MVLLTFPTSEKAVKTSPSVRLQCTTLERCFKLTLSSGAAAAPEDSLAAVNSCLLVAPSCAMPFRMQRWWESNADWRFPARPRHQASGLGSKGNFFVSGIILKDSLGDARAGWSA